MNKRIAAAALLSMFALPPVAFAQPKAAAVESGEIEAVVKVVSVDPKGRTAIVQGPTGASLTIVLPAEAQNLDRVKPGDLFNVRYMQSVALGLQKGGTSSASVAQVVAPAAKGATPGGEVVRTLQVTAVVQAIDRGARTMTLVGPGEAAAATLKVGSEVRSFDEVAVGDTVTVIYSEALAIEMVRAADAGGKADR
jgi:hypothetical protein